MSRDSLKGGLSVNLEKLASIVNSVLPVGTFFFAYLGHSYSFNFHFLTVAFFLLTLINFYYRHIQKKHTLLANFGLVAQVRYIVESLGPEFRQYLFSSDTEERPFNRMERSEVYRKAKAVDSSAAFGSRKLFDSDEIKLRHSFFPISNDSITPYELTYGEERGLRQTFTIHKPIIISAMSYGSLGKNAVRALARGAKKAGIAMNTGEGGFPKYHLMEDCDLIFQMGTAKFGVRKHDGTLDDEKLEKLAAHSQVKMIEIKFSQGAKPGKGGLLPKEKVTQEISDLRGVPLDQDVISPAFHPECRSPKETVHFIKRVQEVSQLPVGMKFCLGREVELRNLVHEMKRDNIFPDYITVDGAEGGTGAAPRSFMDDLGVPIFKALPAVHDLLIEEGVRSKMKLMGAGKLISPGRQFIAFSLGANAVYTARGFMMALGCIQALQCNKNTCPVGITTHSVQLQKGLDIEEKSERVASYVASLMHEHQEILAALGKASVFDLNRENLYQDGRW